MKAPNPTVPTVRFKCKHFSKKRDNKKGSYNKVLISNYTSLTVKIEGLTVSREINEIEARILKDLLLDGRRSTAEIAKRIGITKETVQNYYQEMNNAGIIKGATAQINYKSFNYKAVAHMLITMDSQQADQFIEYAQKMPETYAVYSVSLKGKIHVIVTLKTLQQLNAVKDAFKSHFSISDLKTVIWTDVKEMHENLTITSENTLRIIEKNSVYKPQITNLTHKNVKIDEVDLKITDELSKNGRVPLKNLAEELGISKDTVKRRYEKLKKNGVIKVTIQIDPTKIGYQALAIFFVAVTDPSQEYSFSIINKISRIPDVISIMKTIGDYDLQIYALIRDIDQLLKIQDEIGKIQGITRMDMAILRTLDQWPTPRQYMSTF